MKKLTRKKQLVAIFMAAGIITNTMVSTGVAFADEATADAVNKIEKLGDNQTVHEHNVTLTVHDATIEYGSEWSVEIARELMGVQAITDDGHDLTDKTYMTQTSFDSVDTKKPGDYKITWMVHSPNQDNYFIIATATLTVKEPIVEPKIEANDFEVDYGFDLTDEAAIEKAGAKATDNHGKEEGVKVKESNVDTSKPGEYSITFVSDSGLEKTVKVTVKDAPEENATIEANDFEVDYGFDLTDEAAIEKAGAKATDKYGKEEGVKVKESNVDTSKPGEYSITFVSDSGKEKTVKVTVKAEAPKKPTVDPIKVGAGKVTGQGNPGDKIVITVGGKEVGTGTVKEDGTFEILTGAYHAQAGDIYSVQAFNSDNVGSEVTEVKVTFTSGTVNPDDYTIGEMYITGSYTGDVTTIAVFVDDAELGKISGANVADGKFNFYVGDHIKAGQKVTVVGYDKYGKRLDEKEVTINDSVETPTVNDIYEGDTTVTGTGEVGSTIYVKDHLENIIGQDEVKEDGTFEVTIPAQVKDTKLIVMAKKGNARSEEVSKTVLAARPRIKK